MYDIYELIENNVNGFFGSGTLKLETINTLIKEAKAQNSANVTKAMKIVKGKIKNMPQDIANSDTWSQENKIAMQLYERVNIALLSKLVI